MPLLAVVAEPTGALDNEKFTDTPPTGPLADDNVACRVVIPPNVPDAAGMVSVVAAGPRLSTQVSLSTTGLLFPPNTTIDRRTLSKTAPWE